MTLPLSSGMTAALLAAPAGAAGRRVSDFRRFRRSWPTAELERDLFRLPLSIDSSPRRAFAHVAASLPDQPLPFAADMQNGKITGAERRPFNRKAALLVLCEP